MCKDEGMGRIEHSHYNYSYDKYRESMSHVSGFKAIIDKAFDSLNQLKHKIRYKVSLDLMLSSYFTHCKNPLVLYDNNIQMIVYSYNERSYSFVGCTNNKTQHSPTSMMLLKKYVPVDGNASLFVSGQFVGTASKIGNNM